MTYLKTALPFFYKILFLSCSLFIFCNCNNKQTLISLENAYPIIPSPQNIEYGQKEIHFKNVNIISNSFDNNGKILSDFFLSKSIENNSNGLIIELKKTTISPSDSNEAYQLNITDRVVITASTKNGIFYGIQSLKQLFRKQESGVFPTISIVDWPAFKIRGFMHDTGRNFQSVAQLKEQIEILAQYKYNIFHWHLTDNPGWRFRKQKTPRITI